MADMASSAGGNSITVAVRVRPMNKREIGLGTKCCIQMEENQTILQSINSLTHKNPKTFAFDYSFWSMDPKNTAKFANQDAVFNGVGRQVLANALEGFNACVFAYGQTGSGKSYSMMGCPGQDGLIPKITKALYKSIESSKSDEVKYKVEVSYMEIYNEKVRDLLNPSDKTLKVREHAATGPYVDGLVKTAVQSADQITEIIEEGGKSRTIAATNMNSESSRSHAVFTVLLTQETECIQMKGEKVSRLSLVDLAGSERASKTGAAGSRLKEGSNINKSLTTLGLVISALASGKSKFVPYRDSVLTWLLKDSLGGNSKTAMIATISPAADNYEETLSTLRYADRAKKIVNKAVINEDPNTKVIRELKEEVEKLRRQLMSAGIPNEITKLVPDKIGPSGDSCLGPETTDTGAAKEKLEESEKLLSEVQKPWAEKLKETEQITKTRQNTLQSMGISLSSRGIKMEGKAAYLVNLNPDPALSEMLVYNLPENGDAIVGCGETSYIKLLSYGIKKEHSNIKVDGGKIRLIPFEDNFCHINGEKVSEERELKSGDRLLWGSNHYFKLTIPGSKVNTPASESVCDFETAQREVMLNKLPVGAKETVEALERQLDLDETATTVVTALDEKEISRYVDEIKNLKKELKQRDEKTSSPKRAEKVKRRNRLKEGVRLLKADLARAQHLVMEANSLCERLKKDVHFSVTLRIPPERLGPTVEPEARLLCSAAIKLQRPGREDSIWALDKLEDRMTEMRSEIYSVETMEDFDHIASFSSTPVDSLPNGSICGMKPDPFYEEQQQSLIGVASFYLESLFYDLDSPFEYVAPIVSPNGTSAGKLRVKLARISGFLPLTEEEFSPDQLENELTVRVEIVQAMGLSPTLAHFVECQYTFPGAEEVISVPPTIDESMSPKTERDRLDVCYRHNHVFTVQLHPEVLSEFERGALKIRLLGHQDRYRAREKREEPGIDWKAVEEEGRSLAERWADVSRRIRLDVEIQELEDTSYQAVELHPSDSSCGGIFNLRAGMSRRILVSTRPIHDCGQLPLVLGDIHGAEIGSVLVDSEDFSEIKNPDSYQEKDLQYLRDMWSLALDERKSLLDVELQKHTNNLIKETALFHQVAVLAEERNAVLVPQSRSGMPGAPEPDYDTLPPGKEQHVPVLYLGVDQEGSEEVVSGDRSYLPGEKNSKMTSLTIIRNCWGEQGGTHAVFAWDSSVHDSQHLNRPDEQNKVYLILRVRVKLTLPVEKEIVLRKRLQVQIQHQRRGIMHSLKKKIMSTPVQCTKNSIVYEIISSLPLPAENSTLDSGADDLATMAANTAREKLKSTSDDDQWDPNSAFDRYVKSLQAVEKMLDIDRIRQQAALHDYLEELGIPRIFGKTKHGYTVQSILSPGPLCPPPLGLNTLRSSVTMPSISKNLQSGAPIIPNQTEDYYDSELHAVQRPESALSNISDISHSHSAECSAIVSDINSSDDDDSSDDDESSDDGSTCSESCSNSDSCSSSSENGSEITETDKLNETNSKGYSTNDQLSDLSNLHGSAQ